MALMIVKAEAVHVDEPRIWAIDHAAARATLEAWRADDVRDALHLRPDSSPLGRAAIVDREPANPQPTNEHTPEATRGEVAWQEMVWRQAFNAALSSGFTVTDDAKRRGGLPGLHVVDFVALAETVADAALDAWKKRWQR